MADIIHTKSPLGYEVVCSEEQWCQHVLTGHNVDPESAKNTIEDPDIICPAVEYDNRHVYFSRHDGAEYNKHGFGTKVIVEIENPHIAVGDVITAMSAKTIGGTADASNPLYKKSDKK